MQNPRDATTPPSLGGKFRQEYYFLCPNSDHINLNPSNFLFNVFHTATRFPEQASLVDNVTEDDGPRDGADEPADDGLQPQRQRPLLVLNCPKYSENMSIVHSTALNV